MNAAQATEVSIRYYGELAEARTDLIANAVLVGLLRPSETSGATTLVNARTVAASRGLEVVESRSTRARNYTSLMSVKLRTTAGELWAEGTVFRGAYPRLVTLDGIGVEAALDGTMIVMRNNDRPGVIGHVGTVLGKHGINVASFALGRDADRAIGLVTVDEPAPLNGKIWTRSGSSTRFARRASSEFRSKSDRVACRTGAAAACAVGAASPSPRSTSANESPTSITR
jgi:hypothetical protein